MSSHNPVQRETLIAELADTISPIAITEHQALHASIEALSSLDSALVSKLASRIKLIDGTLDGVPKLASNRAGNSGNGGSKPKQGQEPCTNLPISQ